MIITGSSATCALGLTWGGSVYSWGSVNVLAPLCLGIVGIVAFFVYEGRWATDPIVSFFKQISDHTLIVI